MPDAALALAYTLRPVTVGDVAFLYDLHGAYLMEYVEAIWGWDEAIQRKMFAEGFAPERSRVVVSAGETVGVMAAERRAADWFIGNVAIAPALQGCGLGGALLRAVLADAACERVPVRLQVLPVNPARHLYEQLGFAVEGETPTHYGMISRTPESGQGRGAGR